MHFEKVDEPQVFNRVHDHAGHETRGHLRDDLRHEQARQRGHSPDRVVGEKRVPRQEEVAFGDDLLGRAAHDPIDEERACVGRVGSRCAVAGGPARHIICAGVLGLGCERLDEKARYEAVDGPALILTQMHGERRLR